MYSERQIVLIKRVNAGGTVFMNTAVCKQCRQLDKRNKNTNMSIQKFTLSRKKTWRNLLIQNI